MTVDDAIREYREWWGEARVYNYAPRPVSEAEEICRREAADLAEQVLWIPEAEDPEDLRPRRCIEVARDLVVGKATRKDMEAAWEAGWESAYARPRRKYSCLAVLAAMDCCWDNAAEGVVKARRTVLGLFDAKQRKPRRVTLRRTIGGAGSYRPHPEDVIALLQGDHEWETPFADYGNGQYIDNVYAVAKLVTSQAVPEPDWERVIDSILWNARIESY